MESDAEDIENLFEEYENENNANDAEVENTENKTANETPGAVKIAAPKRAIKNPRLKFNADRLCGERGIPVLVNHFKNVKFKGLGHEKEDLDKLLARLEHWTHRLFPSMKFEDCLAHIERLGRKRQVQTCLRKIRLDMPILNSDFIKDNEDDNVKRNEDDDDDNVRRNEDSQLEEMDPFDRLLGQSQDTSTVDVSALENVSNSSFFQSSPMPNNNSGHVLGSSFGSSMTAEQKERMERNRMLAAERRKSRLAAMQQNSEESQSETITTTTHENTVNKLPDSTDENLNKSSDLNDENSEKLGLDDLMNLVDEDDPLSNENAVASPSNDAQNVQDFNNISGNIESKILAPENSLDENLNIDSSLDLINGTSVDSNVNTSDGCSLKNTLSKDTSSALENEDLNAMHCDDGTNVNEKYELISDVSKNCKSIDNVLGKSKSKISLPNMSEKSTDKNLDAESPKDFIPGTPVNSNVNDIDDCSLSNISIGDKNSILKVEELSSMHCEEKLHDGRANESKTNTFPQDNIASGMNTDDISEISKNKITSVSKKSLEENLNSDLSLNSVSKTFMESNININDSHSVKGVSDIDENAVAENEDFIPMDCDDEHS